MPTRRFDSLDALRGVAMVWMTLFHFCFDLNSAGVIHQDFHHDPWWTWQRTCILSLFLLCAGAGQAIAYVHGQSWRQFALRWGQIVLAAGLVSLGSWWMFPSTYIYFGVLHGMAVMLVLVRCVAFLGRGCAVLALVVLLMHGVAGAEISLALGQWAGIDMNDRAWNWLGLVSRLPVTEDYVPVFPWWGVMLLGYAGTVAWLQSPRPPWPTDRTVRAVQPLARLGRYSLSYYLLHQPVLLGLLWLAGIRL
ncbi:MAG: heparan-alpha-glucosaminide N-acetyltransferase [Rhodoferax sp.]|nr:heparan-alpha-glucosaminide N-acetyltransferase [Rhodoferax sp.]